MTNSDNDSTNTLDGYHCQTVPWCHLIRELFVRFDFICGLRSRIRAMHVVKIIRRCARKEHGLVRARI